jgi:hypothetical protein
LILIRILVHYVNNLVHYVHLPIQFVFNAIQNIFLPQLLVRNVKQDVKLVKMQIHVLHVKLVSFKFKANVAVLNIIKLLIMHVQEKGLNFGLLQLLLVGLHFYYACLLVIYIFI